MENFIKYLFQQRPEVSNEFKGVSELEIQKLESLIGPAQMPDVYRTFLKYMGKNTGRIKGIRNITVYRSPGDQYIDQSEILIDYWSVFRFYKKNQEYIQRYLPRIIKDYKKNPNQYFLFGIDTSGPDYGNFYLDLTKPNFPVVEISETLEFRLRADSYLEFLFMVPFRRELSIFIHNQTWIQ
ncbi:hypothetical protein DSAG12_00959 [Promethearchaeum syntrophicum]|uniref:Knr4/Smi1-like domain-containing protein n=1 Tax=Promethearchaeum syntrophicum TaxID=2594042 RepID=A0A5B9D959_9ARCH|nr:hypothetical protein [Candidatus Prometheoarchaeum syntrophicum]QEE15136.1 hypothetical protein DSAG12_00959 [Candidatus Prometheoarchaeum syntrophicum]